MSHSIMSSLPAQTNGSYCTWVRESGTGLVAGPQPISIDECVLGQIKWPNLVPNHQLFTDVWSNGLQVRRAAVKEVIHHGVSFAEPLGPCPSSSPVELLVLVLTTEHLTPPGFQNPLGGYRYFNIKLSTFMSANKFEKPILLIHGEQYNDPRTLPMQVKSTFLCGKFSGGKLSVSYAKMTKAHSVVSR
ncbi:hypothetical protein TorRG33x02_251900 [Trema orientale]|uniref:Uncharacterized protein n=1 Tax=Trema orientale TaxID=63057 RepID=A0A2P5DGE9_TREOI|nr:hypothetical protein TorRG33x02_251900 [Trema orientale]